ISRKEIKKPDEFITTMAKLVAFYREHRQPVLVVSGGIVAIVVIVTLVSWWRSYVENQARKALDMALVIYNAPVAEQAGAGGEGISGITFPTEREKYEKALAKLEEVVEEYGSTASGKLALFYKGNVLYNLGRYDPKFYDEAIETYKRYAYEIRDDSVLWAYNGIGYAYEAKEDFSEAITWYQKILDYPKENPWQQEAYLNIARCYRKKEKPELAVSAYEGYLKNYPTGSKADEVQRLIQELREEIEGGENPNQPPTLPEVEIRERRGGDQ
ncbi:MAG: hypothetical protein D6795_06150, partial [Deltaproteobacteria bacterium]